MTTAVIVQARTRSRRLPGKVLLPLAGAPVLQRMLERVKASGVSFELVVATTTDPADDDIVDLCRRIDVRSYRGDEADLLERHRQAALSVGAEVVAKVPSDCPLIDPEAIRLVLEAFHVGGSGLDYLSNLHPPSWPDGNDVEVMSMEALSVACAHARAPHEREHTTPFIWDQPERFNVRNVEFPDGRDLSMSHRFTIDYVEDYLLIRAVYDALYTPERPIFSLREILSLLEANPAIAELNAAYRGVNWYHHHLGELRTIDPGQTRAAPRRS
ncbi:MAG TPA: glycosyltransferase family protein [Anaeromyxobacteraceae bacterium]|nr:glycosyltransferase family protein [Anaeromyxobacteraceae bacterium]